MAKQQVHNAIVTRNIESDEESTLLLRGSVYFEAPTLFDGEFPIPAEPCFPFASAPNGAGMFWVPQVGDEIEVVIAAHDPNTPFDSQDVETPEPRWRCMVYSDAADIAEEFKKNYPRRMGWKTNSGHILYFDDTQDQQEVMLQHTVGHFLQMTNFKEEQFVKLFHVVGTLLHMNKDGDWLGTIIRDKVENIARDFLQDVTGDSTETVGGKKVFNVTGDCEINCANAKIQASGNIDATAGGNAIITASQIQLNGAASEATSKQSHQGVIDLITGAPIVPTTTVFLDA